MRVHLFQSKYHNLNGVFESYHGVKSVAELKPATSVDGAGAFSYPVIFLPFISSAFVPARLMPSGVRAFAENQGRSGVVRWNYARGVYLCDEGV